MDSRWLSNAYLVADEAGGTAVFVDSGAPLEPLLQAAEEWRVTPTHVLRTHAHPDHVEHESELGLPVVRHSLETGDLWIDAIPTPGHSDDMVCFVINDHAVFSGDTLFKDAVGGGDFEQIKDAVMDVYMPMPHDRRVLPGHTDETTIGREWEQNPFVRVWRGAEPEGTERVSVAGRPATLVVWSPDYDGKGKAWVRFDDGSDAIVGGSRVERGYGPRRPAHRGVHRADVVAARPAARRALGGDGARARPGSRCSPARSPDDSSSCSSGSRSPQRVLEIGTFSGHSALAMAAALPEGGHIDACELDPERAAFAQRYFDRSPHGSKITLHVGPAARDDRVARRRVRLRLHRRGQGRLRRLLRSRGAAARGARADRRRQHARRAAG